MDTTQTEHSVDALSDAAFEELLEAAIVGVQQGKVSWEALLKLARKREYETLRFCISRMTAPTTSANEEATIARLLQQTGMVRQFIECLLALDPQQAQDLARNFQNVKRGLDLKLVQYLETCDLSLTMRALELLEVIGESKQLLPPLFALLNSGTAEIQSKAALLIQKLDTELVYTRRLLQHPVARVRANALEALVASSDIRGVEYLRQGVTDVDNRVRTLAAVGLARRGDSQGMKVLEEMIHKPSVADRRSAAWGFVMCGTSGNLALLESVSRSDPDARVREFAKLGIGKIQEREKSPA